MRKVFLPIVLCAASCSSTRTHEFWVQAIDTDKKEIPCLILVNREVVRNDRNEPLLTPGMVRIAFEQRQDGHGIEGVELGVKSVHVEKRGTSRTVREFGEGEEPPFKGREFRTIFPTDPKKQLFILVPNPAFRPPQ